MVTLPDFMTRARRELMLSTPDFFFCRAQESTGTLEATAVAGGHWAAHKRCELVDRVAGGAGGARTMVGAANYGRGTHLALASVAHRFPEHVHLVKGVTSRGATAPVNAEPRRRVV